LLLNNPTILQVNFFDKGYSALPEKSFTLVVVDEAFMDFLLPQKQ